MTLDIAVHKNLLIRILKDIYTDADVGQFLGFKGVTAALFFYDLTRFSVDLDFDLLDDVKEQEIFQRMQALLEQYGTVKEAQNMRYNLFFLLSYYNKAKDAQNIKVEINKRNFGSRYEKKQFLSISMNVMVPEDMVAHKLIAMYQRFGHANRDIYDVWFFLHNSWPVNKTIVEQRTKMSYKKFLQKCIDGLEKMSDRNILSGIGELLDEKQKKWAKAHLRTETIFLLKLAENAES